MDDWTPEVDAQWCQQQEQEERELREAEEAAEWFFNYARRQRESQ